MTEQHPSIAVLVLTMLENDESVFAAVRAGARGYLLKGADRAEIGRALDGVSHGEVVFSAAIASRVLAYFAAGRPDLKSGPSPSSPTASARSSTWSPAASPTPRSPAASSSATKPSATTSPTSSPNST